MVFFVKISSNSIRILNNALQITSDERFRLGKNDNILVNVPLYHCFGCVAGSLSMITRGAKMVFPAPSFNPEKALEAVRNENTNVWYGTPTMYVDMLAHPSRANQEYFLLTRVDCLKF